jgi:hypothetical protein
VQSRTQTLSRPDTPQEEADRLLREDQTRREFERGLRQALHVQTSWKVWLGDLLFGVLIAAVIALLWKLL